MMKKLLVLSLFCLCVCPSYAQKGKMIKGALGGRAALTDAVTRQVAKQTVAASQMRLAKITNLPGQPTVQVRLPQTAVSDSPVLSARILKPSELYKNIESKTGMQLYMPDEFYGKEEAAYRGMRLDGWDDLKNLLVNGLQIERTHYRMIYASKKSSVVALSYAVPTREALIFESFLDGEYQLPVIVKIPLTNEVLSFHEPDQRTGWLTFRQDIPSSMISDVMIFLEINGKPDWYKVTLEQGNITFTPAPSRYVGGILDSY